ncbi:CubicO group peptidase, beta-lactamase class C family [Paenibacillus uliginis N3/975]|uniref:CubicO group peptidase, beta-lactamase class C family n=1 Tax=Paenibacillus uliginis N3/975 TaxID=1313296 RepID=A0A1X7HFQ7_9BACL|nr:serine hydrolase domain-containing protein [Paenibacillus uliginis]SMF85869.1 CubicO group peptidase, beta-lactamase class C family [Paenibacillus uliginis N3/975]
MEDLQNFVSDYTKDRKHLHLVIGVIREGDIEYYSFCNTKKKSMIPPENMLFEIGSITKLFTSILLLEMEREKLVSSNDFVGRYVHHVENEYLNKITLKNLVTHTSGLPILATNHILSKNRLNPYSNYTEDDLSAFLSNADYTDSIGSFEYSNTGMGLLGNILCKVSGSTYDDLLKKYITSQLKMGETAVILDSEQKSRLLNGHTSTGKRVPHWDLSVHEGAGAIKSSVRDLSLFIQANLYDDNPIASTLQKSHLPILNGDSNRYFGWHNDKLLDKCILWHNGATYGFNSYLALNKELGIGIVLLSNYCYASISIVDHYFDQLIKLITKKEPSQGVFVDPIGKKVMEAIIQR